MRESEFKMQNLNMFSFSKFVSYKSFIKDKHAKQTLFISTEESEVQMALLRVSFQ